MHITAQGPRRRNDLYCIEWDVKLYYTIPQDMKFGHCRSFKWVQARVRDSLVRPLIPTSCMVPQPHAGPRRPRISGRRNTGMERVTAQCHPRDVSLFIRATSENFPVSATTASIILITVSWSWTACTQHHVNPGFSELNWTELNWTELCGLVGRKGASGQNAPVRQ